jgi:hypothetical protein
LNYRPPRASDAGLFDRDDAMNVHFAIGPLLALIAGILILVMPRLLNFIVAIYLIAIGVVGLLSVVKL